MSLTKVSYSMIDGAVVNVLDYGAVGDWNGASGTDNTTAIQAAFNACPAGGTVYVPAGYYLCGAISSTKPVRLVGAGFTNTIQDIFGATDWKNTSKFSGSVFVSSATSNTAISLGLATKNQIIVVEDIMILGPGVGTSVGLEFIRTVGASLRNVLLANFYQGFNVDNCQDATYDKLAIKGCKRGALLGGTITSNQTVFLNPEFQSFDTYGLSIKAAALVCLFGGVFQDGRSGTALLIDANSSQTQLRGVWFENQAISNAIDTSGWLGIIEGCYFSTKHDNIIIRNGADRVKLLNNFIGPDIGSSANVTIEAGASNTVVMETDVPSNATFTNNGTNTVRTTSFLTSGALYQSIGNRALKEYDCLGGLFSAAGTTESISRKVTNLSDNIFTFCLRVSVPNTAQSATVRVKALGSLGAGGAVGANEASSTINCDIVLTRTPNLDTVTAQSSDYGVTSISVPGGDTCTVGVDSLLVSGAPNQAQSIEIRVRVTKSGGSSNNHTATMFAQLLNMNDNGCLMYFA